MKKFFYFALAISSIALVSCSDDEMDDAGNSYRDNGDGTCECVIDYDGLIDNREISLSDESIGYTPYGDCKGLYESLVDATAYDGYGVVTCK